MSVKNLSALAMTVLLLATGGAFAQKTLYVAQDLNAYERAQYKSIQEAVNRAEPGDIIEILDTEVYKEQVTIDGREKSPWTGVTGGKNGITIKYTPPAGRLGNSNFARPTIQYRDITNTTPVNVAQANTDGELPGTSGNFETCGAVRVLRASNVVIDGIAVDAVSANVFGGKTVWCPKPPATGECSPLFHGNAAITLVVSGNITIRNCDIKNGYFGINVKDRNTGGVFGNKNKSDNDTTIPLSGFGRTGGHLFEYNRIHNNAVGAFFESAWDLGSSIRYNLIYNNAHTSTVTTQITTLDIEPNNQNAGAFLFKDMFLSPLAIYNNTLYGNTGNFLGNWQIGGQHLIFNNIFSRSTPNSNRSSYMVIDGRYPHRMHYSVFSANEQLQIQGPRNDLICTANNDILPGGMFVAAAKVWKFTDMRGTPTSVSSCQGNQTTSLDILKPGALLTATAEDNLGAGATAAISSSASLRWLQTEGQGSSLPTLFESVSEASSDFLVPKWSHADVISFIKNQGWPAVGVRNADGTMADLGAIPSSGAQQKTVVRLKPSNVVLVTGTNATAQVRLTAPEGGGTFNSPKIKFLRWIAPIPENNDPGKTDWAGNFGIVQSGSVRNVTIPTTNGLSVGNNEFRFTLPQALGQNTNYGFFEIVVEGTDAAGNPIVSDVGFLPYRQLDYILKIEFFDVNGTTAPARTWVTAGETYRMRVTPQKKDGTAFAGGPLSDLALSLAIQDAFLYTNNCATPLTEDKNIPVAGKDYQVCFQKAGPETVTGSGLYSSGGQNLVFLGTTDIEVRPGAPAQVTFKNPMPEDQIGEGNRAPVINRGVPLDVQVEVQDKYGNAVGAGVDVSIEVVEHKDRGSVGPSAVKTDADGVAWFVANVTGGGTGEEFRLRAAIAGGEDFARLRIGRTLDRLEVFYSDNRDGGEWQDYFDPLVEINGTIGQWFPIAVKAVAPDTVITSKGGAVLVVPDNPYLIFSLTAGGEPATVFPMVNGVATFYVGGYAGSDSRDIEGCIDVTKLGSMDPSDVDGSVSPGNRCGIKFLKPNTRLDKAVVYGDGYGRPERVLVRYFSDAGGTFTNGQMALPDSVSLTWPRLDGGTKIISTAIEVVDSTTISANFRNAAGVSLFSDVMGWTDVSGDGRGLVGVYGKGEWDLFVDVLDGIGPILADAGDGRSGMSNPVLIENLDPAALKDTLIIQVSESIADHAVLEGVGSIVYAQGADRPAADAPGTPLNVELASFQPGAANGYRLVLALGSTHPVSGNWVRFNMDNVSIKDVAGNGVQADNRWVKLTQRQVPPSIDSAWYTSDPMTGRQNYMYVAFNKDVDVGSWFPGGYFKFGTARGDSSGVGSGTTFSVSAVDGDPRQVRVNLSLAWPKSQDTVETSGTLNVTAGFSPFQEWEPLAFQAVDRAKPVLVHEVVLKIGALGGVGEEDSPDTLEVIYSEALPVGAQGQGIPVPVTIRIGTGTEHSPTLTFVKAAGVSGTSYQKVTYVVTAGTMGSGEEFPKTGDRVYIRTMAGVADMSGNVQNEENRLVPLRIDRGALNWIVRVKNNPFKGSDGNISTVILEPGAKGATVRIKYSVSLYDNVGNLVVFEKDRSGEGIAEWPWDGRNNKGRMVGTGTYLFKAVCDAEVLGSDKVTVEQKSRYSVTRSIGFVR